MFIDCYSLIIFDFPATYTTASAFSAITTAYFPLIGDFIALEYYLTYWEAVGVIAFPYAPVAKNYF